MTDLVRRPWATGPGRAAPMRLHPYFPLPGHRTLDEVATDAAIAALGNAAGKLVLSPEMTKRVRARQKDSRGPSRSIAVANSNKRE